MKYKPALAMLLVLSVLLTATNFNTIGSAWAPAISIDYPADGQVFTTPVIAVNGTAASYDFEVSRVKVKVDSENWQLAEGTESWNATVILSPGSNTIYAKVIDTAGNFENTSVTVTYTPLPPPQAVVFVNVTPSNISVVQGQNFSLSIMVGPAGTPVSNIQMDMDFDPSILQVINVTEGDLFAQNGANTSFSGGIIDNNAGIISGISSSVMAPDNVTSPSTLAIVAFTALSPGISDIILSGVQINSFGNPYWNGAAANVSNGVVNVFAPGILHDVSLGNMTTSPGTLVAGDSVLISAALTNKMPADEENIPVIFSVDGAPAETKYFNLSSLENRTINFNWTAVSGDHNISFFANLTSDSNAEDNSIAVTIHVGSPQAPSPSGGGTGVGGGGGGGGYGTGIFLPAAGNKNAYFSNMSVPDSIFEGERLFVAGCIFGLDRNGTIEAYLDSTKRNETKAIVPSTCFNLSEGIPKAGKRIAYIWLNGTNIDFTKSVSVIAKGNETPPIQEKPELEITEIITEEDIFVDVPTAIKVSVRMRKPDEASVFLFSNNTEIGRASAIVSEESVFPFNYTFEETGIKTLQAVARTKDNEDIMLKRIDVKKRIPTGGFFYAVLRNPILIGAIIAAIIAAIYFAARKKTPKKNKPEASETPEGISTLP